MIADIRRVCGAPLKDLEIWRKYFHLSSCCNFLGTTSSEWLEPVAISNGSRIWSIESFNIILYVLSRIRDCRVDPASSNEIPIKMSWLTRFAQSPKNVIQAFRLFLCFPSVCTDTIHKVRMQRSLQRGCLMLWKRKIFRICAHPKQAERIQKYYEIPSGWFSWSTWVFLATPTKLGTCHTFWLLIGI